MEICKERGIDPTALEPAEMTAEELAAAIDTFSFDYDTYGYWDSVDDREEAVKELTLHIASGNVGYMKEWLQSIVDEDEIPENIAQAQKFITELARFEAPQKESHRYYITQEALDKGTYPVMESNSANKYSKSCDCRYGTTNSCTNWYLIESIECCTVFSDYAEHCSQVGIIIFEISIPGGSPTFNKLCVFNECPNA